MSQAFSPYEDTLIHEPEFVNAVLEHDSADVAGQRFTLESLTQPSEQPPLVLLEEQLLAAMKVDGRDGCRVVLIRQPNGFFETVAEAGQEDEAQFRAASLL